MTSVSLNRPTAPTVTIDRPTPVSVAVNAPGAGQRLRLPRHLSWYSGTDPTGGSECGDAVQDAIDDAAANGYHLIVDGVFDCGDVGLLLPDGLVMFGLSWVLSELVFGWTLAEDGTAYLANATTDGTVSGVLLDGFTITGAGDGTPWGPNEVSGEPVAGVRLISVSDSGVTGCRLRNIPGQGIVHSGVDNRFDDNRLQGVGRDGITGYWRPELGLRNTSVCRNTFRGIGDDVIGFWAGATTVTNGTAATVSTTAGSGTVTGSGTSWTAGDIGKRITITGAAAGGGDWEATITAVGGSTSCTVAPAPVVAVTSAAAFYGYTRPSGLKANDNDIVQATAADADHGGNRGILFGGCEWSEAVGNTIDGTRGQGVRVGQAAHSDLVYSRGVTIEATHVIRGGQYAGASYEGRRHGVEFERTIGCSYIGGSIAHSYGRGFHCRRSFAPKLDGTMMHDNGTAADDYGVEFWGSGSGSQLVVAPLVKGVTILRSQGGGVHFFHCRDGSRAEGCTIISNGQSGTQGSDQAGIVCEGSQDWFVVDCTIIDLSHSSARKQWGGIRVTNSGGSPHLTIDGCYIVGNGAGDLVVSNASATYSIVSSTLTSATSSTSAWRLPAGAIVWAGTGSPEGVVTAGVGSVYCRTDGTAGSTLYSKTSGTGNTGWTAVGSGGSVAAADVTVDDSLFSAFLVGVTDAQTAFAAFDLHDHAGMYDDAGTATLAVAAHAAAADPHPGYLLESAAGDLALLDTVGVADIAATGTPDGTTYLRGDGTWSTPAGGGSFDLAQQIAFGG